MKKKFQTVIEHIKRIKKAKVSEFSKKTKDKAKEIEQSITEDHFISTMNFQLDVLSLVSRQSLFYQKSAKSTIGDYKRQIYFSKNLDKLKEQKTYHFSEFLQDSKCTENLMDLNRHIQSNGTYELPSCETLEKFEKSKYRVSCSKLKLNQISSLTHYLRLTKW